MKMRSLLLLFVVTLAYSKHCDFIGKAQGRLIASTPSLDSLCSEFADAYKNAKSQKSDVQRVEGIAKNFQEKASGQNDSSSLRASFISAIEDFKSVENPEPPTGKKSSSKETNWGAVIMGFSALLLAMFALYVPQLRFVPNTVMNWLVIGGVGMQFSSPTFLLPLSIILGLFAMRKIMRRCPTCKALGSSVLGHEILDVDHGYDKDNVPQTSYRQRVLLECRSCGIGWSRGGFYRRTRKGHFHPD